MGISTAGHLPSITSTAYPALVSHVVSAYNGQKSGQWSVSVRIFRSVVEGAAARTTTDGQGSAAGGGGGGIRSSSVSTSRSKLMYVVQMSEFPDETFVLIEDPQRETRASMKARHAFAVMQAAAEASAAAATVKAGEGRTESGLPSVEGSFADGVKPESDANLAHESAKADSAMVEEESKPIAIENAGEDGGKGAHTMNDEQADKATVPAAAAAAAAAAAKEDVVMLDTQSLPPPVPATPTVSQTSVEGKPTRLTLFISSSQYLLLLMRLNLPAPLGAPSMGDGANSSSASALGPGAWVPRGQPVTIQGSVYDIPSATGYGSGGAEWRVRVGMVQSGGGGTRNAGAVVEAEYLPLLRLSSDTFLSSYLQSLFPSIITGSGGGGGSGGAQLNTTAGGGNGGDPVSVSSNGGGGGSGIVNAVPTPEQWQEVIPSSNEDWMKSAGLSPPTPDGRLSSGAEREVLPLQQKDPIGWRGKERGRRLAFLYVTLLRNQSVI